jgi:ABC-type lipoprotein release transport system permease subunit
LTNLQNVALLPTILGIGLAALALAALSYVLIVTGRARRRDFAILRAIGLDTRATQYIVFTQAAVIAVVGLVIGVPLGIVTARLAWREIANRVPLVYVPPSAIGVVAVAVPASLILTFLVATWPAHRVARDRASARLQGE